MRRVLVAFLTLGLLFGPAAWAGKLAWGVVDIVTTHGVKRLRVEIAETPAAQERGLMFRRHLAPDRGMWFAFAPPEQVAFWMKNTFIPLDLLFIAPDGRLLSIARSATPFSETQIPAPAPVSAVLEIAGGRAEQLGIEPGDKVRLKR